MIQIHSKMRISVLNRPVNGVVGTVLMLTETVKLTSMNVTQTLKNIGLAHHLIGLLKETVCGVLE